MAEDTSKLNPTDIDSWNLFSWDIHLLPAEQKTEEWALGIFKRYVPYLRPVYSTAGSYGVGNNNSYAIIRAYANGTQDPSYYKTMFSPQDKEGKYLGINFTNLPAIIPRFRQKLIADLLKMPIEIKATAVDPVANDKRGKDKERLKAEKALDEKLAELSRIIGYDRPIKSGISKGILKNPSMGNVGMDSEQGGQQQGSVDMQFDLSDDVELQMYMDAYYSMDIEVAMELSIESIFKLNEIQNTTQRLIEDAVDYGRCAGRVYCSNFSGMPVIEHIDIANVLVPSSVTKDMKKAECWAMQPLVTLNELLRSLGHCLTPDDVRMIYEHSIKTYGYRDAQNQAYPATWNSGRTFSRLDFDIIKVPLYYMEFRSPNSDVYEKTTTRYGDKKLKKKDYYYQPTEGKERVQTWYDVIYKGYYINGIDRVFDYGILPNMVREKGYEQMTPYSLVYWRFEDRSVVEKMIPHVDNIIILWLKLQYMVLKAKPAGYSWNVDAMSDIVLGDGGTITAIEQAKMYEQTGSMFHHSLNEDGTLLMANANAPHMELKNGLDPNIMILWQAIRNEMEMISQAIGLNEFTDAATPSPDALVGVQKMAVLNSQDARYYLRYGIKTMIENFARRTSLLIQQIAKWNPKAWEQIKGMVGRFNTDVIETMEGVPASQFAIYFEDSMTEQEKQEVKQFMLQAYSQGKLDLSDVLQLYFIKNYKLLIKLLTIKYNKRQAEQMKMAAMGQQMQAKTEQDVMQLKVMLAQIDAKARTETAEITGKFNLLQEEMKQTGDLNKKLLQEITKLNLANEDKEHEHKVKDKEHEQTLQQIAAQKQADLHLAKVQGEQQMMIDKNAAQVQPPAQQ